MNKEFKKAIEDLGWVVQSDTCITTDTGVCDREICIECNEPSELKETIRSRYENFDVDEEAEMYIEAKQNGLKGVPSIRTLVNDLEDEEEKYAELWEAVEDLSNEEEDDEEDDDITEDKIREDWETALEQVNRGSDLSSIIGWAFSDEDITELAKLHKANICRDKIEDLLTDCNFHYECGKFANGEYDEFLKEE